MLNMENAEEVMQILERFTRLKQKEIPKELDEYMHYVAKTGDTVFKWSSLKYLFREKLLNVIKNFHDTSPRVDDIPQYPNVDPFNYESMKSSLLERLELFNAAPFTVQRLCELLTEPRKQYSRIDKFMRALEKNILVVSTIEPGRKQTESENGDSLDSVVNGDVSLDVNVDIEMENETIFNAAAVDAPNSATVAAVAAAAIAAAAATTPATAETTPTAQPLSHLIHKADDDILPNPKKAKLDLDGAANDAETEAATKSIAASNNKPESTNEVVPMATTEEKIDNVEDKKQNDVPTSEEKPSTAVVVENVAEENKIEIAKPVETEKMEEDLPDSVANDEAKNEDKKLESEKKTDDVKETVAPADTTAAPTEEGVALEKSEPKAVAVETIDSTADKKEVAATEKKEDCSQEKTNDITEKDEKKSEDDVKSTNELKTDTVINTTTNDKQLEMAVDEPAAATVSGDKIEKQKEKTEEIVAAPVVEKENEAEAAPTPAPEEKSKAEESKPTVEAALEEKTTPVEEIKTPAESATKIADSAAAQDQTVTESPQIEAVAKQDDTIKSTDKETEKPSTTVESAASAAIAVTEPAAEKIVLESAEAMPADATPSTEKVAVDKDDLESAASSTTDTTPAIIPPTDVSPAADTTITSTDETKTDVAAAPTTDNVEAAASVIAKAAVVEEESQPTEPAAAAVISADQPMEENPPESIAEAEPVVPAIVVVESTEATVVEEIVMGDSVEMATDITEPAKDEPAGMEVDDTSQEAMDQ